MNVFPIICYLLSSYFLFAYCHLVGVPPEAPLPTAAAFYLLLALFLFLLPEAKKIKFGKLFEYEAHVEEMQKDIREFKDETRNTLSVYSTLVSAISNTVSQTINLNLPGAAEMEKAKSELDHAAKERLTVPLTQDDVEVFLDEAGGDSNYALAKLRMQIEYELRRILNKPTMLKSIEPANIRFLSPRSLYFALCDSHSEFKDIKASFDYVLRICNAAIHGQAVPRGHAQEALTMGMQILLQLKQVERA